jgi:hypothetical protein
VQLKIVKPFVLDCEKVSHKVPGAVKPTKEYNGLGDKHLRHFFQRDRTVKDLQKNGLIDNDRNIVPTFEYQKLKYKIKQARKKHVRKQKLKETQETANYTEISSHEASQMNPVDDMNDVRYFNRKKAVPD